MNSYSLVINPVDPSLSVVLPPAMQEIKLDHDLKLRAQGFWQQSQRLGFEPEAVEFLTYLGAGFKNKFNRTKFEPKEGDLYFQEKTRVLDAIEELSIQFDGRISTIVWESLAYLGTRPDPTKYASILAEKQYLPLPYYIVDTVLHALGKVYGLKLHIDSVIFRHSGMIFEHNCDCSCSFHKPQDDGGGLAVFLSPERFPEATGALFSHLVSESLLLMGLKMPFEMGLSPESGEIMAAIA
jgi:hypothetical protein